MIVIAVRWYFSYRLSAANIRNLLAERGLDVSRQTVADRVQKFSVLLAAAARRHAKPLGMRWFVDETYVRIGNKWAYLATMFGFLLLVPAILKQHLPPMILPLLSLFLAAYLHKAR